MTKEELRTLIFESDSDEDAVIDTIVDIVREELFDEYLVARREYKERDPKDGKIKKHFYSVTIAEQLEEISDVLWKIYSAM